MSHLVGALLLLSLSTTCGFLQSFIAPVLKVRSVEKNALVTELQRGDPSGSWRRALAAFPDQHMARRVEERYFLSREEATTGSSESQLEATVLANFCKVWLAKHSVDDGSQAPSRSDATSFPRVERPVWPRPEMGRQSV